MRIAVSNIAWPAASADDAAALLREHGAEGVELAPTKIWPEPLEASEADAIACRAWWEERGLQIVGMQALLFGKPELTLFRAEAARRATLEYLKGIIRLAGWLGAGALVFGSPKNRRRDEVPYHEAFRIAVPFFRALGDAAAAAGTSLCVEPNPAGYGCDFVTHAVQAVELVDAVGSPGFGLHADVGGLKLNREPAAVLVGAGRRIRHFHASEPFLHALDSTDGFHADCAAALRATRYAGWVSIEMNEANLQPDWREGVARSLSLVRAVYGDVERQVQAA